jgi:hypothetical protein
MKCRLPKFKVPIRLNLSHNKNKTNIFLYNFITTFVLHFQNMFIKRVVYL